MTPAMPMQGWTDGLTKAAPSASELEGTLLSNWEKREMAKIGQAGGRLAISPCD